MVLDIKLQVSVQLYVRMFVIYEQAAQAQYLTIDSVHVDERVIDLLRETPFSPKHAILTICKAILTRRNKLHLWV